MLHLFIIFCSGMQSFYFSESQDALVLQICHEKWCSMLIRLQFHDSLIWETASPRTHKPKIVKKTLQPSCKTEIKSTLDWSSGIRLISTVNIISVQPKQGTKLVVTRQFVRSTHYHCVNHSLNLAYPPPPI